MRKAVFGLSVALATFFCGFLGFEMLDFENKVVPISAVEEIKSTQIQVSKVKEVKIEEKSELQETVSDDDYIGGWYQLDNFKGMEEVNLISLSTEYENEKLVTTATVFTGKEFGDKLFHSVSAQIDNRKANFKTKRLKGIEYRFEGHFFKNKTSGEDGEKVLRGTLRKFVRGKKVAEVSGDFAYYEPRCWH